MNLVLASVLLGCVACVLLVCCLVVLLSAVVTAVAVCCGIYCFICCCCCGAYLLLYYSVRSIVRIAVTFRDIHFTATATAMGYAPDKIA
jgi:hypothetical protein